MSNTLQPIQLFCETHYEWLCQWWRRQLGHGDHASDFAHDTFLRMLRYPEEVRTLRQPRAYLTTIARGLLNEQWRRRSLERAALALRQDIQDCFGRPAKAGAQRRHHDGAIDQDRMLEHEAGKVLVRPFRIRQPQLVVRRALLPERLAHGHFHGGDQRLQRSGIGRRLQVLDDLGLFAAIADKREDVT